MKIRNSALKPATTTVLFLAVIFCLTTSRAEALPEWPWWPFKINRFDKEGRFHGRWKIYLGEGKEKVLLRNGRFRHGKEVGNWHYYYPNGNIYFREKHKRWANEFSMKRYHESGKLMKEGRAIMINNGKGVNYFWFGEWKVYDEQGKYTHTEVYSNGDLVAKQ